MALIYVPERKIKSNFKPDFPVEIDPTAPISKGISNSLLFTGNKYYDHAQRAILGAIETGTISQPIGLYGRELYTPNDSWVDLTVNRSIVGAYSLFWVCKINAIDSPWGGVFAKIASGTTGQITFGRNNTTNTFYFAHSDASSIQLTSSAITTGTYKSYGITFDGTNATYFENGVAIQTVAPGALTAGTGPLILGASRNGLATYDSDINWVDFQVFDGTNIGAAGIALLHNKQFKLYCPKQRSLYVASGITAALTGQPVNVGIGSVKADIAVPITGQSSSFSQGIIAVSAGVNAILTGQSLTSGLGSVSSSIAASLAGQSIPASIGTVSSSVQYGIAGQGLLFSSGSLYASVAPSLTGQSISLSAGNVVVGGNVMLALTGQSMMLSLGSVVSSNLWTTSPLSGGTWTTSPLSGGTWTTSPLSGGTWTIQ